MTDPNSLRYEMEHRIVLFNLGNLHFHHGYIIIDIHGVSDDMPDSLDAYGNIAFIESGNGYVTIIDDILIRLMVPGDRDSDIFWVSNHYKIEWSSVGMEFLIDGSHNNSANPFIKQIG